MIKKQKSGIIWQFEGGKMIKEYLITYKKRNGKIFFKNNDSMPILKIGQTNGYGWEVIDIHQYYDGNFLHDMEILKILDYKKRKRNSLKNRLLNKIIKILQKATY